jgi:hypothetical protein
VIADILKNLIGNRSGGPNMVKVLSMMSSLEVETVSLKEAPDALRSLVLLCYKNRYPSADFPGPGEWMCLTWAHEAPSSELARAVAAI